MGLGGVAGSIAGISVAPTVLGRSPINVPALPGWADVWLPGPTGLEACVDAVKRSENRQTQNPVRGWSRPWRRVRRTYSTMMEGFIVFPLCPGRDDGIWRGWMSAE